MNFTEGYAARCGTQNPLIQMLCETKASSLCSVPEAPSPEGEQIIKVHQLDKEEGYSSQNDHHVSRDGEERAWCGVRVDKHFDLRGSKGACGRSLLVKI